MYDVLMKLFVFILDKGFFLKKVFFVVDIIGTRIMIVSRYMYTPGNSVGELVLCFQSRWNKNIISFHVLNKSARILTYILSGVCV